MKICIAGADGQVGRALMQLAPVHVEALPANRSVLDVGERDAVLAFVDLHRPQIIINVAAYTAVDRAESEPLQAARTNVEGVRNLALAADRVDARLIHVSTNYVFDGEQSTPYLPSSPPRPINVYGRTKYQGEQAALAVADKRTVIVRTAWVYAAAGNNFVKSMLRLMTERDALDVVADELGTPTSAAALAQVLWQISARAELRGIYHWTDGGSASRYEYAVAIQEEAIVRRLLTHRIPIRAVRSRDFAAPALRPRNGVLDLAASIDALGDTPLHWRENLGRVLDGLAAA
ncbi:MAG: dTDP-4-dehydrorhamnose reductase [Steroidobacteraceae bacterium]